MKNILYGIFCIKISVDKKGPRFLVKKKRLESKNQQMK